MVRCVLALVKCAMVCLRFIFLALQGFLIARMQSLATKLKRRCLILRHGRGPKTRVLGIMAAILVSLHMQTANFLYRIHPPRNDLRRIVRYRTVF
jgi:hypothetical protein